MSDEDLLRFKDRLADLIEEHVAPLFVPECRITLVVRTPGKPSRTIVVSSDVIERVVTNEVLAATALVPVPVAAEVAHG